MPERLFVSFEHCHTKKDPSSTRAVRSWVTKVQHARQPRRQVDRASPTTKEEEQEHANQPLRNLPTHDFGDLIVTSAESAKVVTWSWEPVDPTSGPSPTTRRRIQAHVAHRQHEKRRQSERGKSMPLKSTSSTSSTFTSPLPTPLLERTFSASPPFYIQDPADPLGVYARRLNTSVPVIWSHYLWREREHGRAFGEHYPQFQGWGPKYLHPFITNNRAFLATTVLFTGAHLRFLQGHDTMSIPILQLRSLAHDYVQAAIDSESERLADSNMLAIVKLALLEAIFGIKEAYKVHMRAVARMVQLRMGLLNLGMEGYTARLLVWFDANLSATAGSPRYLAEEASRTTASTDLRRNEETFRLGVHERMGHNDDV
ncbi:hypothetical protein CLAFUW4_06902 [Fulvia fulva]|uniref:Uncharacterized protein n=1 Tax=Passalora fulva TaxID=5499 RepID=A0A9Q8PAB9_PASFU|nr:uncharacterized protein CLAFUR5_07040 [Fulvia fulva]KAK4621673.1 hypothetical protein CLAFUR4_06910 [Fulvia fulva]KAK4623025.1 hypothetical protein CLAFUR0_06907 [Fulvia fulva]UJO18799.1 hypothetical protein CLAFUR5_07040 [Fulvia fulva]WPV15897.1 hypothetical protein CLAFUW4_06902 [Fulvia fulva]WPV30708.1 hypothetical protein CLAFUW7_06901 [Fulvia fulva]